MRTPLLVSALIAGAACASGGSGAAPRATPETTTFAPALAIDLGAMRATGTGVYVRDVRVGDGATAARGMVVAVRYRGWLPDGTPIDSTAASERPVGFVVGRQTVIAGWEDGVVGMRVGGVRRLVIPPRRGYGAKGSGPIPPDAVLVFDLELVGAREATAADRR